MRNSTERSHESQTLLQGPYDSEMTYAQKVQAKRGLLVKPKIIEAMPGYGAEIMFMVSLLFMAKFYSETFWNAMTFFNICVPILLFLLIKILMNIMEYIKFISIDDDDE